MEGYVCPVCGGAVPPDAPDGACPHCLRGTKMGAAPPWQDEPTRATSAGGPGESIAAIGLDSGRYRVVREHARGGMGRILLAHDPTLGRDIALKELLPQPGEDSTQGWTPTERMHPLVARFLREARITGQLEHPAITPVHELGQREDGTVYYTMKFVKGRTLDEAIKSCKNLKERLQLLPHFVDLCNAIAYAHSKGVIHRDIKPQNVLVGEFGETVVVDWGLAKVKDRDDVNEGELQATLNTMRARQGNDDLKTSLGEAIGTPAYMPPEQVRGELFRIDERSDIYALGVVLYQMLTGELPFRGRTVSETLAKVLDDAPRSPWSIDRMIPADLVTACLKAMEKKPGDRYASAKELGQIVERSKQRKPKGRIRKTIERGALAAVIGIPLLIVIANWYTGRQYNALKREVEATGLSLNMSDPHVFLQLSRGEVATGPTTSPDTPARWEINPVAAMFSLDSLFPSSRDIYTDQKRYMAFSWLVTNHPSARLAPEQQRLLEEFVETYEPLVDFIEMTAASNRHDPEQAWSFIFSGSPASVKIPDFQMCRLIAQLFAAEARLSLHHGDGDGMVRFVETGIRFANSLGGGHTLIGEMMRLGILDVLLAPLPTALASGILSDSSLHDLYDLLAEVRTEESLERAYEMELLTFQWYADYVSGKNPHGANNLDPSKEFGAYAPLVWMYGLWPFRFVLNMERRFLLSYHRQTIEAARLPWRDADRRLTTVYEQAKKVAQYTPVARLQITDMSRSKAASVDIETRIALAITALAIERYRLDHGQYPEALTQLIPEYTDAVPMDPFSDGPLQFESTGMAYRLASTREEPGGYWLVVEEVLAAVRMYEWRNCALPEGLEDLVPNYLIEIPRSPIPGAQFTYSHTGDAINLDFADANGVIVTSHLKDVQDGRMSRFVITMRAPGI